MAKQGKGRAPQAGATIHGHDSEHAARGDHGHGQAPEHETVTLVRGLAEIVAAHGLTELIVDTKDTTLTIRRGGHAPTHAAPAPVVAAAHHGAPLGSIYTAPPSAPTMVLPAVHAAAATTPAPAAVEAQGHVVTSPFVGTFYRKPNPDSASYVALGDRVEKGAVLCIVEAMKLMNEIEADASGTITAILVEDGSSVEYGQALFRIAT